MERTMEINTSVGLSGYGTRTVDVGHIALPVGEGR